MSNSTIRVGIVGAGANTRLRHIPGFQSIEGVELAGVVNRSAESTASVAQDYGIPKTYSRWRDLVADESIDAVLVGTWPNLHCEVTCAALAAGKHVLTEARMARNAEEAQRMLAAARARPELVAQIVPSPFGLVQNAFVRRKIDEGFLGPLRELVVVAADAMFHDCDAELHWRQDAEISGVNTLALGIFHESAMRWVDAETTRVFAQRSLFGTTRRAAGGGEERVAVGVPDSVQIVTKLEGGARGMYHISGVCLFGPEKQIHLYGAEGTIKYIAGENERLLMGRAGDECLEQVEIPSDERGGWRVEAEFIGAIRGEERVRLTDFATGVKYMQFTDAVARSSAANAPIALPLASV